MSETTTNGDAGTAAARSAATGGRTKEEQLIALFMELNGVSESQARAVYGHLDMARALPAQTLPDVAKN